MEKPLPLHQPPCIGVDCTDPAGGVALVARSPRLRASAERLLELYAAFGSCHARLLSMTVSSDLHSSPWRDRSRAEDAMRKTRNWPRSACLQLLCAESMRDGSQTAAVQCCGHQQCSGVGGVEQKASASMWWCTMHMLVEVTYDAYVSRSGRHLSDTSGEFNYAVNTFESDSVVVVAVRASIGRTNGQQRTIAHIFTVPLHTTATLPHCLPLPVDSLESRVPNAVCRSQSGVIPCHSTDLPPPCQPDAIRTSVHSQSVPLIRSGRVSRHWLRNGVV